MNISASGKVKMPCALLPLLISLLLSIPQRGPAADLPTNLVVLASSDFEIDADGWTGTNGFGGSETVVYKSGGALSNSVGFVGINETVTDGTVSFLVAPGKFLGDRRAAYNGFLVFYHRQNKTANLSDGNRLVVLGSGTNCLSFDLPVVPGTEWSRYILPLNENSGWHLATVTNATRTATSNEIATKEQIILVLSALDRIQMKCEYSSANGDQVDIDDIFLLGQPSDAPEPQLTINTYAGLLIHGAVGSTYAIEYRNVFDTSTNWLALTNVVLPASPYFFADTNSPSASSRFYRAVLTP